MIQPNTVNDSPSTIHHLPSTLAILASEPQKSELRHSPAFQSHHLVFADGLEELVNLKADAYIDLLFETDLYGGFDNGFKTGFGKLNDPGSQRKRIESLASLLPSPVFINSVIQPLSGIQPDFIRINGWPGFLEMPVLEAAAQKNSTDKAGKIFGDHIIFVKDVPGFVNPRIISMIINEAYFTLGAGTSTRPEIDIAMKLGTGYPLGPFEWGEKIGTGRVAALLTALGEEDLVYVLAPGLGKDGW